VLLTTVNNLERSFQIQQNAEFEIERINANEYLEILQGQAAREIE
jgi:hypothetical protein